MTILEATAHLAAQWDAARAESKLWLGQRPGIEVAGQLLEGGLAAIGRHVGEVARQLDLAPPGLAVAALGVGRLTLRRPPPLVVLAAPARREAATRLAGALRRANPGAGIGVLAGNPGGENPAAPPAWELATARAIWGDAALVGEWAAVAEAERAVRRPAMVEALAAGAAARWERAGATVFLLQPDVVQSPGALADLEALDALAWVAGGRDDAAGLAEARTFLVGLGIELLLGGESPRDQLTFALQMELAARLGYLATEHSLPEELLLRDYYRHASLVDRERRRQVDELRGPQTISVGTAAPASMWLTGLPVRDGVVRIGQAFTREVESTTDWVWPLAAASARGDLAWDAATIEALEAAGRLDAAARADAANCRAFLDVLASGASGARVLRGLHETGVLDAYMPEFALVRHLPRIDHFHQFALDEHMLRCVETAAALRDARSPLGATHGAMVARELLRPDLLALAALLHDVGKGEGRGHVARGARLVEEAGARLGLPARDIDVVRQLVLHHHRLSHLALAHDLDDPDVDEPLVDALPDLELLRMLYVLTVCDVRSVSTEAWNDWRGSLLASLYEKATARLRRRLGIDDSPALRQSMIVRVLGAVTAEADPADTPIPLRGGDVARFLGTLPEAYRLATPEPHVARHLALHNRLSLAMPVACQVDGEGALPVAHVVARDCPGLLGQMCLAVAAAGMTIVGLHAYTATTGCAVAVFHLRPGGTASAAGGDVAEWMLRLAHFVRGGTQPPWPALPAEPREPVSLASLLARPIEVELLAPRAHEAGATLRLSAPWFADMPRTVAAILDRQQVQTLRARFHIDEYQGVMVLQVSDWENNPLDIAKRGQRLRDALIEALAPPRTINSSAAVPKLAL